MYNLIWKLQFTWKDYAASQYQQRNKWFENVSFLLNMVDNLFFLQKITLFFFSLRHFLLVWFALGLNNMFHASLVHWRKWFFFPLKLKKEKKVQIAILLWTLPALQRSVSVIFRWLDSNDFICTDSIYMKGQFEMGRSVTFMNGDH